MLGAHKFGTRLRFGMVIDIPCAGMSWMDLASVCTDPNVDRILTK